MMNWIWAGMILLSVFSAARNGTGEALTTALFSGAENAVTLVLSLAGAMCLWSGLMRVADRCGITGWLARAFRPVLHLLFPGLSPESKAAKAISMNLSANLLGMGNAATPFGIQAMRALSAEENDSETAMQRMVTFVVLNTASFQLIPSTIAMLRAEYGSIQPFSVMPQIWLTSAVTLSAALTARWLFASVSAPLRLEKHRERRKSPCRF